MVTIKVLKNDRSLLNKILFFAFFSFNVKKCYSIYTQSIHCFGCLPIESLRINWSNFVLLKVSIGVSLRSCSIWSCDVIIYCRCNRPNSSRMTSIRRPMTSTSSEEEEDFEQQQINQTSNLSAVRTIHWISIVSFRHFSLDCRFIRIQSSWFARTKYTSNCHSTIFSKSHHSSIIKKWMWWSSSSVQ